MFSSRAEMDQDGPLLALWDKDDSVEVILRAIMAGESPIIAVQPSKAVRTHLRDRLIPALRKENVRVLQAMSPEGKEIRLVSLMEQIVGDACADVTERSERCHATLTNVEASETRLALIIDDAHLLTSQTLRYLDLIISLGQYSRLPLQIVLVGAPEIWSRLPSTGGLAADKAALRIVLPDEFGTPLPNTDAPADFPSGAIGIDETIDPVVAEPAPVLEQASIQLGGETTPASHAVATPGPDILPETPGAVVSSGDVDPPPSETPAPAAVPTPKARRTPLVLAAFAGVIVVSGGLAGGLLVGGPPDPNKQSSSITADQPQPAVATVDPAPAPEAAVSPSVTPQARPDAVSEASNANPAEVKGDSAPSPAAAPVAQATNSPVALEPAPLQPPSSRPVAPPAAAPDEVATGSSVPPPVAAANLASQPATNSQPNASASASTPPPQALQPEPVTKMASAVPATAPSAPPTKVETASEHPTAQPVATATRATPVSPAPAPQSQAASHAPESPPVAPAVVSILVARGDELLATGDITAARLMYQRAATSNSAQGAIALGMTYDPRFLARIGAQGIAADPQRAIVWYRRAADLGSPEGTRLLAQMQSGTQN